MRHEDPPLLTSVDRRPKPVTQSYQPRQPQAIPFRTNMVSTYRREASSRATFTATTDPHSAAVATFIETTDRTHLTGLVAPQLTP